MGQVGMSLVSVGRFAASLPNPYYVTDVSAVPVLGWWDGGWVSEMASGMLGKTAIGRGCCVDISGVGWWRLLCGAC